MSQLTIAEHINEAMEQAGNTGLATRLETMYPVILRSLYASCPWPFVKRTSNALVSIAAGDTGLDISPANFYTTPVDDGIMSIRRVAVRDADGTGEAWDLDIVHEDDADAEALSLLMPSTRTGRPWQLTVQPKTKTVGADGIIWRGSFNPIPERALSAVIIANCAPEEDLTTTTNKPVFVDDELIIHACYVYCLRHQQDERALAELQELKSVLGARRAQLKSTSGKSKKMQLSRARFGSSNQQLASRAWHMPWW